MTSWEEEYSDEDEYEYDAPGKRWDDDPPNDYDENQRYCKYDIDNTDNDHEDDEYDGHQVSADDTYHDKDEDDRDQEYLFRCAARFKGGTICGAIFTTEEHVYFHLNQKHHTSKWLVDEFVKIKN